MEYLGYKKEEFERAISSFEKIQKYIKGGFLVVGGLVIRSLFPEFGKTQGDKLNNIDIVFYPAKEGDLLNPEIKKEFYVTHIYQEFFGERNGFYFALVDKNNFAKINLFMPERDVRTREIEIAGKEYNAPSNEEIYLNNLRDLWYLTNARVNIDIKRIEFLEFLENNVNLDKKIIGELWPEEKKAIKYYCWQEAVKKFNDKKNLNRFLEDVVYRNFDSFEEYTELIKKKIKTNQDLFKHIEHCGYKKYPTDCPKAWGLEIEDEKTFEIIKEKWRDMEEINF